jgi:hypothetical protein
MYIIYFQSFILFRVYSFSLVAISADSVPSYGISQHCDEWKYIITGRIFESEIILIPPSLKISESSSNGSYRNTTRFDEGTESAEIATSEKEYTRNKMKDWK